MYFLCVFFIKHKQIETYDMKRVVGGWIIPENGGASVESFFFRFE